MKKKPRNKEMKNASETVKQKKWQSVERAKEKRKNVERNRSKNELIL